VSERALVLSDDLLFIRSAREYLTLLDFDVVAHTRTPEARPRTKLIIVDVDAMARLWWKYIAALRRYDKSVLVLLVGSRWPSFARLRAWRPCGFIQKPFSTEHLSRVLEHLEANI
jgi:hypothetical protein